MDTPRPCPNHQPSRTMTGGELVLHLVLTVFTCGAWGPVLLLVAIARAIKPRPCPSCGRA